MTRTIIELDAPAHWASALVNSDANYMEENDREELDAWLASEGVRMSECMGIANGVDYAGDAYFIGRFDYPQQGTLLCDMFTYTFIVEGESK